jgi:hypothetical protein
LLLLLGSVGFAAAQSPDHARRRAAEVRAEIERKRAEIQRKAAEHRAEIERKRAQRDQRRAEIERKEAEIPFRTAPHAPTAADLSPPVEPGEFSSVEGKFKVFMPGKPKKQTLRAAGMTLRTFSIEDKDGAYVVAYADVPIPSDESPEQIQKRLRGARDGMLNNINGELTSESRIWLQGTYPGRELSAELPGGVGILRARIYLVQQRMYQIMAVGTPARVKSADTVRFLESLTVTP